MKITNDKIVKFIKNKIDIQYHFNVFKQKKEIKTEWMSEAQKPESLIDQLFIKLLKSLEIPENQIISQNRIKLYDIFKERKYRYPDYKIIKNRKSPKNLLIELEPYNSDIHLGINQAREWIQDINIGTFNNALVINFNFFILIYFDGTEVKKKELSLEKACDYICEIVFGGKTSIKLEEINKITEQFYNQFYAIIHGGTYSNLKKEIIKIEKENCILNNLVYDENLKEEEKIEFVYTIFNRLIFIKILIDWQLIPPIFSYLKGLPKHLIHTELKNLFFKTLAIRKEERQVLAEIFKGIPFLNGGLFRISDIEKENPDLLIQPKYIIKILDFLGEYAFIDGESSESSINSEILGYIFEKTIDFRKGTGSYYTHRLICEFMCENTLYPMLLSRINEYLITIDYRQEELFENFEEIFMLKEKTLLNVYNQIIKPLKVCDICVGSGAFLLSMANLILMIHKRILRILNQDLEEIEIKKHIVEYNLYGVDIMPSAIQICQLRLWLWITENSKEVQPLPNIEYNLRLGNSLLGTVKSISIRTVNFEFINRLKDSNVLNKEDEKMQHILKNLESGIISFSTLKLLKTKLIEEYLYSHDKTTLVLKKFIEELNELIINDANRIYLNFLKEKIKNQELKKQITLDFLRRLKVFHWYVEFPQVFPKGFDIIIGNPPYISTKFMEKIYIEQEIQEKEKELQKRKKRIKTLKSDDTKVVYKKIINKLEAEILYNKKLFSTDYYQIEKLYNKIYKEFLKNNYVWAYKIYDILVPFFERGFSLLNKNSYISFITSNKFLSTDYGAKIRKDLLLNKQIDLLIDISMIKVFKDAAVYPIIITLKNSKRPENWKIKIARYTDINDLGTSIAKIAQERYISKEINYLIYIPMNKNSFELFDKIFYHQDCFTVGNEFIGHYREFDFTKWKNYEIFVKKNPGENFGEDYLYYITNNDIEKFQIQISEQSYFYKIVSVRDNPKKLNIPQEKWDLFKKKLLLIKEVALELTCALSENYVNIGKLYGLRLKEDSALKNYSYYYFLALFNSNLLDFYFRVIFWNTHLSGGYLNYHFSYLSVLPILRIELNSQNYKRIVLLSKILTLQYNDLTKELLDMLILHVYFPKDFPLNQTILESLDRFTFDSLNKNNISQINALINKNEIKIKDLELHEYYQIILKERKFK
ncbi:MAG: Eco57I restriction-modification methylase domain-containing protein [Candidatus Thorarchaeota archaeon]